MSLNKIIEQCASVIANEGGEFDADDVLTCLYRDYSAQVSEYGDSLIRSDMKRRISSVLKRRAGENPEEEYEQLSLHGFENAPRNVPFYDGEKVRYIATLSAKRSHLLSAIKLREDNVTFCVARKKEYLKMLDYIDQHHEDITFGEAIKRSPAQQALTA